MTDQFLADSGFSFEEFDVDGMQPESFLADPDAIEDYNKAKQAKANVAEIDKQIMDLLEKYVKPAVEMDIPPFQALQ